MNPVFRLAVGAILTLITTTSQAGIECKLTDAAAAATVAFDKLDRFSPYALEKSESTNSVEKLKEYPLASLAIALRRQFVNELNWELQGCGLSAISKSNLASLDRVGDYLSVLMAKIEHRKEITITHQYTTAEAQITGVKSRVVTLLID